MCSEKLATISPELLEQYLRTRNGLCLILDCRPFLAHNESHIVSAINIHCPPILRRRTGGRLPLRTIVPDAIIRDRLLTGHFTSVVLYEEEDVDCGDSMLGSVASCLLQEATLNNVFTLNGGFRKFRQLYPGLCNGRDNRHNQSTNKSPLLGQLTWPLKGAMQQQLTAPSLPQLKPAGSSPVFLSGQSKYLQYHTGNKTSPLQHSQPNAQSLDATNSVVPVGSAHREQTSDPVEILPHLLLGSEFHASQRELLKRLGITALLNVSHTCPNHFEQEFIYKCIPVQDCGFEDIAAHFQEAIAFIDQVNKENGRVLVHCHAGISRSATICMAYMMASRRLRMEEAYEFVKNKRQIVSPNFSFMGQLLNFESKVFGTVSNSSTSSSTSSSSSSSPDLNNIPHCSSINTSLLSTTPMISVSAIPPPTLNTMIPPSLTLSDSALVSSLASCSETNESFSNALSSLPCGGDAASSVADNRFSKPHHQRFLSSSGFFNESSLDRCPNNFESVEKKSINIFDFSTTASCIPAPAAGSNSSINFSPMKKLSSSGITPLLSPT